jgi:hypothetical protein
MIDKSPVSSVFLNLTISSHNLYGTQHALGREHTQTKILLPPLTMSVIKKVAVIGVGVAYLVLAPHV